MNVYISCLLYNRKRKKKALEEDIPKKKVREMKYNKNFTERLYILESTSYNNKRYQPAQPNKNYYSRRYFCFPQRLLIINNNNNRRFIQSNHGMVLCGLLYSSLLGTAQIIYQAKNTPIISVDQPQQFYE